MTLTKAWRIASKLAEYGVPIIPVPAKEKGCKLANWPELATTDVKQVAAWAVAEPNGNYGCVASADGFVILDADNPGLRSHIERTTGKEFPDTLTVKSSKGYHYYFKQTEKTKALGNRKVPDMFDLQSSRKYVVGPGSIHPSGVEYKILTDADAVEMPDWLTQHLEQWSDKVNKPKAKAKLEPELNEDFEAEDFFDWFEDQNAFFIEDHRSWNGNDVCITDKCIISGTKHSGSWHTGFIVGNGRFGYKCESPECENPGVVDVLHKLTELGFKSYPKRIWEEQEIDMSKWTAGMDEDNEEPEPDITVMEAKDEAVSVDYLIIRNEIDEIMRMPNKEMPVREKYRYICGKVYKHMLKYGKLYDCGNVATYLDGSTQELIQVISGSVKFNRLLMHYGIMPSDALCDAIGQFLGARATTDATKATIYNLSYYDASQHVLYVNEHHGNFLRIDGDGRISRHRNGEFDMLFNDGTETECDPLQADLELAKVQMFAGALRPEDGSALISKHILDTILYDEDKIGRESSHIILMCSILSLYMYERVPSYPYVFLFGAGAAMKSALAKGVGKLVQGRRFRVRAAEDDVQKVKDLAISLPFLVLDEANNVKKLTNLLKSVGTGAMDSRRELYTTAKMRHTPYQARIWMTANTASLTNETISSRMLIIDAAPRNEAEPYRSEHYLEWSDNLRNEIWTELVGRLAKAMYELRCADESGQGDLHVDHRMSSFFVLGRSIARQEGYEDLFLEAMKRMTLRQQGASAEGNDIVDIIKALPKSYAGIQKPAKEWARILSASVPERNRELVSKVSRTGWVAWQFTSEFYTLTRVCGMAIHPDKHNNTNNYSFSKLEGGEKVISEEE